MHGPCLGSGQQVQGGANGIGMCEVCALVHQRNPTQDHRDPCPRGAGRTTHSVSGGAPTGTEAWAGKTQGGEGTGGDRKGSKGGGRSRRVCPASPCPPPPLSPHVCPWATRRRLRPDFKATPQHSNTPPLHRTRAPKRTGSARLWRGVCSTDTARPPSPFPQKLTVSKLN